MKGTVAEILAAHHATSGPDAELWHRYALGELSSEEVDRQLFAGTANHAERSDLERCKRVFAPLPDEQREVLLDALLARRTAEQRAEDSGQDGGPASDESAVVVPMRRRWKQRWTVGLGAAVATAVLTLLLVRPPEAHDPFPGGYIIELDHAVARMRGVDAPTDPPVFLANGKIVIRLVPEEAVIGPIGVVACARDQRGRTQELAVEPTVHDGGVVEIATTVEALGLAEGVWELVVVIGWAAAVPESCDDVMVSKGAQGIQVVRQRVRVERR